MGGLQLLENIVDDPLQTGVEMFFKDPGVHRDDPIRILNNTVLIAALVAAVG
jgi:hypothetical protein